MKYLHDFNHALYLFINAPLGTSEHLVHLSTFLANDVVLLIPAIFTIMWFRGNQRQRETLIFSVLVTMVGLLIAQLIGLTWYQPRPFVIGLGETWLSHAPNFSFPSNHFTVFMCIAITFLLQRLERMGAVIILAGYAVAWSRIYLGVHYPFDMVGSVFCSLLSYWLCLGVWKYVGNWLTGRFVLAYRKLFKSFIDSGIFLE